MKTARLLFCFIIVALLYSFIASSPAFAQEEYTTPTQQTTQPSSLINFETNPDVPRNIHTLTQGVTLGIASSISCLLFGIDPLTRDQRCLAPDPQTNKLGYVEHGGSAIGFMNNMISALYTPPIHAGEYVGYLSQNFGITKNAYAQTAGGGFESIKPIIGLWIAFRNITYLFFVIVFTIIGIAIMLRVKIDPRTVMSIENQIPKLILGIILVTLSFPIAGFLIDIMWVVTYLIISIIQPHIPTAKTLSIYAQPMGFVNDLPGGILGIILQGAGMIKDIIIGAFPQTGIGNFVFDILNLFSYIIIWPMKVACALPVIKDGVPGGAGGAFCTFANDPIQSFIGFLGGFIAFLIIGIMILTALFRLWITLLKAYVSILLAIVLAPFWIVAGALPGSPLGFGAWIRSLLSNLLVFPASIAVLMLGFAFMHAFSASPTGMFAPPLLGLSPDPGIIGTVIGIGTILLASQTANILKDAFKSPSLKYTAAIGQTFGGAVGTVSGSIGTAGTATFGTAKQGDKGPTAVLRRVFKF